MEPNVTYRGNAYNTEEHAHRETIKETVTLYYRGKAYTKEVEVYVV